MSVLLFFTHVAPQQRWLAVSGWLCRYLARAGAARGRTHLALVLRIFGVCSCSHFRCVVSRQSQGLTRRRISARYISTAVAFRGLSTHPSWQPHAFGSGAIRASPRRGPTVE